jgi:hypothetical protein
MPDVYNAVTDLDPPVAQQLGDAMELRATEPAQQAMLTAYLDDLDLVTSPQGRALRGRERRLESCQCSATSVVSGSGSETGAVSRAQVQPDAVNLTAHSAMTSA